MSPEGLSIAMMLALVVVLMAGFPVAFTLAATAAGFGIAAIAWGYFDLAFLSAISFRIQGVFQNDNFLAIPFLVLMGILLERTGIAEDMLVALDALFGRLAGGLGYATVLLGAVLSAITGFVSASVIALGLIALPVMLRSGYDRRFASGITAASGTLAQILPPSLVLIVLAEQLEVPLLEVYRGALIPGVLLVAFYLAYICLIAHWRPHLAPTLPAGEGEHRARSSLVMGLVPVGLVAVVLASIYFGVATPSEAGAIGVIAVLAFALARRRITRERLSSALEVSGVLCCVLIFLLFGASFFTLVFRGLNGHLWIESLFSQGPAGALSFVVFVNVVVFLLAFVLDFFEIAFIVLPLLGPIAHKLGVDMVWLSVLLAVNLQTSFMHPPFGIALYNLRTVAPPSVRTVDIYWGALPFIGLQLAMVGLLIAVPGIVARIPQPKPIDPATIQIELPSWDTDGETEKK